MLLNFKMMKNRYEGSRSLSFIIVLFMMMSSFLISTGLDTEGTGPESTRMVNGEKGTIRNVDLGSCQMTDLVVNDEDAVELTQEEGEIEEDFKSLGSAYLHQNVIPVEGSSSIVHSFRKSHGGTGSEAATRCIRTSDGGYALTGSVSTPFTRGRLLLMKLDRYGEHLWTRSFGGFQGDCGYDLLETSGGDLVVVGTTSTYANDYGDIWLIRTDRNGIEIWNQTYDINEEDIGLAIVETSDGKFAISGYTWDYVYWTTDLVVMMVEPTGEEIWNETYGDEMYQMGEDIIETQDGSLMVIGTSDSNNWVDQIVLWKFTTSGSEIWNHTYGNQVLYFEGYRLEQLAGGDVIAFGQKWDNTRWDHDFVLVRTDSDGKEIWLKTYGFGTNDRPFSMTVNATGITMIGHTDAFSGGYDALMIRTDLSGTQKWYRYYGGGSYDSGVEALPSDFGFYAFGNSQSWGPGTQGIFVLNLTHEGDAHDGRFVSNDVLSTISTSGLMELSYYADIPPDAKIMMRFSNDLINWYDSSGTPDAYDTLSSWDNTIDLSDLEGFDQRFHYELRFTCDKGGAASIGPLTITYSYRPNFGHLVTGTYDIGDDSVEWGEIGMDHDIPRGTEVRVRIRTGKTEEELSSKEYVGPDGSNGTFYDYDGGEPIWEGHDGEQVIQIMANLSTGSVSISPKLESLHFTYDIPGEIVRTDVDYSKSDIDDPFNFTLVFSDADNDPPDLVMVQIDGENITMEPVDDDMNVVDGKKFYHETMFTAGEHEYRFFVEYDSLLLSTEIRVLEVAPGPLFIIEVTPTDKTVTSDEAISFSARGFDRQGNDLGIVPVWEVTGGGTIDQGGNFTPTMVGTWTAYANMSGISGHATFTVTHGLLAVIEVTTDTYSISADDSIKLLARGYDSDGNEIEIDPVWTVEGGGTIDVDGNFSGDVPGMWKIFATHGIIQGSLTIEVIPGALHRIEIEPSETTMNISETVTFSASGFDADGNHVVFEPGWRTGGGGLMHVSGIFTAEIPGTWKIYCNTSGVSGEATVIINPPPSADDDDDDIVPHGRRDDEGGISWIVIILIMIIAILLIIGLFILFQFFRRKKEPPVQAPEGMMPAPAVQQLPIQGGYDSLPQVQQPALGQEPLTPKMMDAQPQGGQLPEPVGQIMEQPIQEEQLAQEEAAPDQPPMEQPLASGEAGVQLTYEQGQVETSLPDENVSSPLETN